MQALLAQLEKTRFKFRQLNRDHSWSYCLNANQQGLLTFVGNYRLLVFELNYYAL